MSDHLRNIVSRIVGPVAKLSDRQLLNGAMATSALVAMADRRVETSESLTVQVVLAGSKLLKDCDRELALDLYAGHVDGLRDDFEGGKADALKAIRACVGDIDAAQLMVNVGIAIAKADREFSDVERETIEEICEAAGIQGLDLLGLAGLKPRARN